MINNDFITAGYLKEKIEENKRKEALFGEVDTV